MIIIKEKKAVSKMIEKVPQVGDTFVVKYWGVPVTYQIAQTPNGRIYYKDVNNSANAAAKELSKQADKIMFNACKNIGIFPLSPGGHTAESFLPTMTDFGR